MKLPLKEQLQTLKPVRRESENLSEREWKEIMGQNKPTYKRHNGAFRQKG